VSLKPEHWDYRNWEPGIGDPLAPADPAEAIRAVQPAAPTAETAVPLWDASVDQFILSAGDKARAARGRVNRHNGERPVVAVVAEGVRDPNFEVLPFTKGMIRTAEHLPFDKV
jgi:hypothetical protein